MRLPVLFLMLTISSFSGCGNMPVPEKPKIEIGVLDVPAGEVITNKVNTAKIEHASDLAYKSLSAKVTGKGLVRVPILEYDRAIALKPRAWEQEENYLGALEDYVRNHCH